MGIKVFLNVMYNICIFICAYFVYYSIKGHNWPVAFGAVFLLGMVIIFKLRLLKDIRNSQKKP